MAIVSVTVKDWSTSATRYNILVLLSIFGVYLYRDIWPLATFTEYPEDFHEGYMLWVKFSIITLTAVVIPLFIPRQYVAVDPEVHYSIQSYFRALIFLKYIGSDAGTKSRTDVFPICFGILHISRPSYNIRLSRSPFTIRPTSSSFRFGLLQTYHEARLPGMSIIDKAKICTELET